MSRKVRIGAVSYLNTRPLVRGIEEGLGAERIELSYAVPSALAEAMNGGRLDIALLPVIELGRQRDLEVAPGLGIVTHGASASVLLVATRPVDEVRHVALDPESRTSNALVQVLFDRVWKGRPEFRMSSAAFGSVAASLGGCDAAVRIGDKALFEPPPDGAFVYDLGSIWTEATGLPFVFAVWAGRPGALDDEIYRLLHASRREGVRAIEAIAESYLWNGRPFPEVARRYLEQNILFRLGAAEIDAMRLFLRSAADLGLIDEAPEIRLALRRNTACHEAVATPVADSVSPDPIPRGST